MLTLFCLSLCVAIASTGCLYSLGAAIATWAFHREPAPPSVETSGGVTVLKPLHGAEPGLYESLVTFLHQDRRGEVQFVFGVGDGRDTAIPVVQRLIREFPDADIELVTGARQPAGNAKIANLATMSVAIRHDIIVLSDSDIRVTPDYLRLTCDALSAPDVGLVTCLYRGGANGGLWSALSSMAIDFHFFPSVLVGIRLAKASPCMGATMAFRKATLEEIGGFRAFAGHLADDYAVGQAIRDLGKRVAVAPHLVVHQCDERSVGDLFVHELRWARTIRGIDPRGYAGSAITHPLPFAMVAAVLDPSHAAGLGVLFATLACRTALHWQVERAMGISTRRVLLGPFRDLLSFAVFCASFLTDVVVWRGRRYRLRPDGTLEELKGLPS